MARRRQQSAAHLKVRPHVAEAAVAAVAGGRRESKSIVGTSTTNTSLSKRGLRAIRRCAAPPPGGAAEGNHHLQHVGSEQREARWEGQARASLSRGAAQQRAALHVALLPRPASPAAACPGLTVSSFQPTTALVSRLRSQNSSKCSRSHSASAASTWGARINGSVNVGWRTERRAGWLVGWQPALAHHASRRNA